MQLYQFPFDSLKVIKDYRSKVIKKLKEKLVLEFFLLVKSIPIPEESKNFVLVRKPYMVKDKVNEIKQKIQMRKKRDRDIKRSTILNGSLESLDEGRRMSSFPKYLTSDYLNGSVNQRTGSLSYSKEDIDKSVNRLSRYRVPEEEMLRQQMRQFEKIEQAKEKKTKKINDALVTYMNTNISNKPRHSEVTEINIDKIINAFDVKRIESNDQKRDSMRLNPDSKKVIKQLFQDTILSKFSKRYKIVGIDETKQRFKLPFKETRIKSISKEKHTSIDLTKLFKGHSSTSSTSSFINRLKNKSIALKYDYSKLKSNDMKYIGTYIN